MRLLEPVVPVLAVQIFWLTIAYIGWSLTLALIDISKGKFVDNWKGLPIPAKFLLAAATSFTFFGVLTTIGYIFKLPPWWLGVSYALGLGFSITYSAIRLRRSKNLMGDQTSAFVKAVRSIPIFSPFTVMMVLVLVDLAYHFFIGGLNSADGYIHISKIRHLMTSGFTLTDAYYGTVPETRHTITAMHTLVAIPSWLGINPITSWYASEVFFRLVKLSAVFYLGWRLLENVKGGLRLQYTALIVILSLALFNNYILAFPSVFVTVFIILFLISLLDAVKGKNFWVLMMSAALIAWTHPLASLAMALFLMIVGAGLLLFDRKVLSKKFMAALVVSFLLLISTPVYVSTLPDRMLDDARNYAANLYSYITFDSHQAFKPNLTNYFNIDNFTAIPWPVQLISLVGIVGLLVFLKNRSQRIVVLAAVLFVPLILYNPVAFSVLKKVLPVWGLARFYIVDEFVIVFGFFGMLAVCVLIQRFLKSKYNFEAKRFILPVLFIATMIIFFSTQTFGAVDPVQYRDRSMYVQQKTTYGDLSQLARVLPNDPKAIVFADRTDSFMIPVVANLRVVAINEFNSTGAADMADRLNCSDSLYLTLDPGLMKQAHVRYVLTKRADTPLYRRALAEPKLRQLKQDDRWVLFKFDSAHVMAANNPVCHIKE